MSLRRFRLLVENLPPGNPLQRARDGYPWSDAEQLLWQVESRVRELIILTANVYREKGAPPMEPTYLPRPLSPEEAEQQAAQRAYDDLMQRQLEEL